MTDKQCSSCGGFCGKVCERGNVVESKEWDEPPHYKCGCKLCKEYWSDDIRTIYSGATRPPAEKLHVEFVAEPPNSATDVVEPEEPLCYLQEIDTLGGAYEQVAWGEGFPVYTAPQNMEVESTQAQELYGKTERLEAEIKRLQEREWVGLTDEDMQAMFLNDDGIRIARYIEVRIKEKNNA